MSEGDLPKGLKVSGITQRLEDYYALQLGDPSIAHRLPIENAVRIDSMLREGFIGPGAMPMLQHLIYAMILSALSTKKSKPPKAFEKMYSSISEWMGRTAEDDEGTYKPTSLWNSFINRRRGKDDD